MKKENFKQIRARVMSVLQENIPTSLWSGISLKQIGDNTRLDVEKGGLHLELYLRDEALSTEPDEAFTHADSRELCEGLRLKIKSELDILGITLKRVFFPPGYYVPLRP